MDLFEKLNRAFATWYEGLFGAGEDLRPRDILRAILSALEDHRTQGLDGRIYAPNRYQLELTVADPDEEEYLLAFLDREELIEAIRRYCEQNRYVLRGELDFTVTTAAAGQPSRPGSRLKVRCRYTPRTAEAARGGAPEPEGEAPLTEGDALATQMPTVASTDGETVAGIAMARLEVHTPGQAPSDVPLGRDPVTIGRSRQAANTVVLAADGMVSRRHARIERDTDGLYTIYDLDSTNGTFVNGVAVDNRTLYDGDEIVIGGTRMFFRSAGTPRPQSATRGAGFLDGPAETVASLAMLDGDEVVDRYVLASETTLGRGLTNHICIADRSVRPYHACVRLGPPWRVEPASEDATVAVNGAPLPPGAASELRHGDTVDIGQVRFRFEERAP